MEWKGIEIEIITFNVKSVVLKFTTEYDFLKI